MSANWAVYVKAERLYSCQRSRGLLQFVSSEVTGACSFVLGWEGSLRYRNANCVEDKVRTRIGGYKNLGQVEGRILFSITYRCLHFGDMLSSSDLKRVSG